MPRIKPTTLWDESVDITTLWNSENEDNPIITNLYRPRYNEGFRNNTWQKVLNNLGNQILLNGTRLNNIINTWWI